MHIASLMAGTSSRLLPRTKKNHKAMLKIGTHRMIDIQMQTFIAAGIQQFTFVIGHGGPQLASHLLSRYSNLDISVINNNHFSSRNLDWSAHLALSSRPGDVVYYEGDIIAAPEIIRELAAHPGDVCVVGDPVAQSAQVDTRVVVAKERARQLIFAEHGDLSSVHASGSAEFVCLLKLSDNAKREVLHRLEKVSYTGPMKLYEIFSDLFAQYESFFLSTAGRPWVEIDNEADLARARGVVAQLLRW